MGRKAKRLSARQVEVVISTTGEAFQAFNNIYSLIHDNHRKSSRIVSKYYTTWRHLREFLDLMELEVERTLG